jgi:hypothetical protein
MSTEEVVVAGAGVRGDHERASFEHESVVVLVDCSSSGFTTTVVAGVVGEDAVRESGVPVKVHIYSPTIST